MVPDVRLLLSSRWAHSANVDRRCAMKAWSSGYDEFPFREEYMLSTTQIHPYRSGSVAMGKLPELLHAWVRLIRYIDIRLPLASGKKNARKKIQLLFMPLLMLTWYRDFEHACSIHHYPICLASRFRPTSGGSACPPER